MYNTELLANIEYLREKANVSYEEAERLLNENGGNVMRVLVELERQGQVYSQASGNAETVHHAEQAKKTSIHDETKKVKPFIKQAMATRLVVKKKREDGKQDMVANVPVPFAILFALCAPWLTIATAVVAFATGYNVNVDKAEEAPETA